MQKIRRFIKIIIVAIATPFLKMGRIYAKTAITIPSAKGELPSGTMYGVTSPFGAGFRLLGWVSLGIILPILIILGITTLVRLNKLKKVNEENANTYTEAEEYNNTVRLKKIIIWAVVTVVDAICFLVLANIFIEAQFNYETPNEVIIFGLMGFAFALPAVVWLITSRMLPISQQTINQMTNQNPNPQYGNQPNQINQNNQQNNNYNNPNMQ